MITYYKFELVALLFLEADWAPAARGPPPVGKLYFLAACVALRGTP